ncbi:TlpA family protein disulfide reductase [Candidatus Nanopelagicus hibericus]|uniref:TlpA family protein disulfide reductase n=1 Tax=Candidatus Nanopelagicus hibericus TaxID=1884915 RepID=UPI001CBC7924|nr:TlpA disulfide reductase family protein [Candidatus Nanopelagicus hibericus]
MSTPNENAFISGSGIATYLDESDRGPAPKISGQTLTQDFVSLDSKKVSVINVWASWCAPCRAEAPVLQEFSINYPEVQFAGILTRDNISSAQAFYESFNLTYPTFTDDSLLLGFGGSLIPNAIPTTLIIDKQGRVAVRISGEVTVAGLKKMLEKVLSDD